MFRHKVNTRFSSLLPNNNVIKQKVIKNQTKQKHYFRGKYKTTFHVGDNVIARSYKTNTMFCVKGVISRIIGNHVYIVDIPEKRTSWKRHANQMKLNLVPAIKPALPISSVPSNSIQLNNYNRPKRNVKAPDRLGY